MDHCTTAERLPHVDTATHACRWLSRTAACHRWRLRAWFTAGAAAGLVAGAASVGVLLAESATLLRPMFTSPSEAAVQAPRLALALPGVTLPASHAAPLWLALAASLVVHEVCVLRRSSLLAFETGSCFERFACPLHRSFHLPGVACIHLSIPPPRPPQLNCRLGMRWPRLPSACM